MAGDKPPPPIIRPIPRRPFATEPAASSVDQTKPDKPRSGRKRRSGKPSPQPLSDAPATARFLDVPSRAPSGRPTLDVPRSPGGATSSSSTSSSLSRAQSIRNLTSSTLAGIFSSDSMPSTPWGSSMGAGGLETPETPARSPLFGEIVDDDVDDHGPPAADDEGGRSGLVTEADVAAIRQASLNLHLLQRQTLDEMAALEAEKGQEDKMQRQGQPHRQPQGQTQGQSATGRLRRRMGLFLSILVRAALLFTLGMGYGVLVSRLHSETQKTHKLMTTTIAAAALLEDDLADESGGGGDGGDTGSDSGGTGTSGALLAATYDATYDWRYLVAWGVSGVVLGTLLPWFDSLWDRAFGAGGHILGGGKRRPAPETDWALVVRGIGAFAGVVFAMRKLPWASTMQATLTLALTNPFLWYLLDRSKSGLLLSAAVGFAGWIVLSALNLDLMPNPGSRLGHVHQHASHHSHYSTDASYGSASHNCTLTSASTSASASASSASSASVGRDGVSVPGSDATASPGLVSLATFEMAVWMVSVLFCSCICFGNIGRRLALRPAAAAATSPSASLPAS